MDTTRTRRIDDALDGCRLLDHPFYVRWQAGELREGELRSYAEQYRHFERALPIFLTSLAALLEPGSARDAVAANLVDEVGPPSHLDLFERFSDAVGARDAEATPAMRSILEAYDSALHEGADVALAGLAAYESQGAEVADTKRDGLIRHYGVTDAGLDFWTAHGSLEDDHARWTIEALDALDATPEAIRRGVELVGGAWWDFLSEREALAIC